MDNRRTAGRGVGHCIGYLEIQNAHRAASDVFTAYFFTKYIFILHFRAAKNHPAIFAARGIPI
jgi:hypothetical protein